jgi:hypothetical protein
LAAHSTFYLSAADVASLAMKPPANLPLIVPGIELESSGHVKVEPAMGSRLIELAIELEPYTKHPVDVQHVVAAIILAVRAGELPAGQPLPEMDKPLLKILARHVDEIFDSSGGRVSIDD